MDLNFRYKNEDKIKKTWQSVIENAQIIDDYKATWLAKTLDNMSANGIGAVNEAYSQNPYSTQANTLGIGGIIPAPAPAGLDQFFNGGKGSPDRYPNVYALAVQIAQKTIGFDLVNVIPMQTPAGQVAFADFYYADGSLDGTNLPSLIKIDTTGTFQTGQVYFASNEESTTVSTGDLFLQLVFAGNSAITGEPIFEVGPIQLVATVTAGVTTFAAEPNLTIAQVFTGSAGGGSRIFNANVAGTEPAVTGTTLTPALNASATTERASLVTAIEDHIQGYEGSGRLNTDRYVGNRLDRGTRLSTGLTRSVAEKTYPKMMSLEVHTKFIETVERQIGTAVGRQQMFDLNKVQGIEVVPMLENLLANQLSQAINKEILELLFAMGWTSTSQIEKSQGGFSVNLTLDSTLTTDTTQSYVGMDGNVLTCTVPGFKNFGGWENQTTIQNRIATRAIMAGNLINQRNRNRGGATFIVTNAHIATALQASAQYTVAPINNNINQNQSNLHSMGTLAGMTIYVDPNMDQTDNRILVGRRGADLEPGLKFMPYAMAEQVSIIAEATMAPKMILSSRYALMPLGIHPNANYVTIHVRFGQTSLA